MIIAIVLTAGIFIGSVGWYVNTSSADIEPESKAEIYNFIKDTYVSQKQYGDIRTAIRALDDEHHDVLHEISKNFTSISKTLGRHDTNLLILNAANQIDTTPTSMGTADYELRTINIQNFQATTEFPQNMPVYITGIYDGTSTNIEYEVRKNGQFVQSGSASISANTFTFAYNIDGSAELGTYVVTVSIDNKRDTVTFEIE